MIRHVAVVAMILFLSPPWLCAQSTELTVNHASANVHKSPSTGSPVIGKAPRGAVLEVTRELGSWVKVSWPDAQDGIGYVHLSVGSIARRSPPVPNPTAGFTSAPPASSSAPPPASPTASPTTRGVPAELTRPVTQPAPTRTMIALPTHIVGVGGRLGGSTLGFGATARVWSRDRLGMQFEVSRYALPSAGALGRVTSIQFAPSLLYLLPDSVAGYVWVRPYLGGGADLYRLRLSSGTSGASDSVSDNRFGLQAFGGAEMTFASVPRVALSADLGYHWSRAPLAGVELGGLGFTVSGHWYVK